MKNYNSGYKPYKTLYLKGDRYFCAIPEDLEIRDLYLITDDDSGFLICPECGTTLLLDNTSVRSILQGKVTNHLAFVMVQRGMASYRFSRPIAAVSGLIRPSFFLIDMTKSCNLNCLYCFRELDRDLPSMKKTQMIRITEALIRHMREHSGMPVSIQAWGGEPLLKLDMILLMRHMFDEAGLVPEIAIETNGTLISKETAKLITEANIHVGISIDGNSLVHDLQRPMIGGSPSLNRVENGIKNLRDAGCRNFGTITVVTRNTLRHLEEIIDYFAKDLHLKSIKFNLMRKTDHNEGLAIDPDEIESYADRLLNHIYHLYKNGIFIREQNIRQRLLNLTCRPDNNICNACGCQGGRRMLSIDPEGSVYPCELTDYQTFRMGSVEESFDRMAQRAAESGKGYFEPRNLESCKDCPWFYYCKGGCKSAALYAYGQVTNIDETECRLNKTLYPRLVNILLNDTMFADKKKKG